ncbi:multidrug resistance-associated 4-like, partial [Paramuricea clavata]
MSMNAGEVMELVCDDTHRLVTMADQFLPNLVRQTAKVIVYITWLLYFVGWNFVPGLGVFTILALFRLCMTKIDINYRKKASQLSEKRLGYLREVLTIIHSVKLNCLEHVYEGKIQRTRWQEIKYKAKRWIILSASFSFTSCGQHLSTFVIVLVLIYTDRSMLTFDNLFTIMVLSVGIGEIICMKLPISIHFSTDIITGLTRIQRFLESCDATHDTINEFPPTKGKVSEIDEKSSDDKKSSEVVRETPYVCLDNVFCKLLTSNASYAQTEDVTLLNDISITISSKKLVIITGSVGSGKSSLLSSILHGELHIAKGSIKHFGNIAYVSDTPWVFPGTIRENILFGLAYDEEWYSNTIKACQLERDFKRFPDQDLSHIGEHGATLSGGQRTRIALARAVYSRADIYLLDDPFSSLDAKVAENVFNNVFKGLLSERIVFAVTLNPRYLAQADYIVKLTKADFFGFPLQNIRPCSLVRSKPAQADYIVKLTKGSPKGQNELPLQVQGCVQSRATHPLFPSLKLAVWTISAEQFSKASSRQPHKPVSSSTLSRWVTRPSLPISLLCVKRVWSSLREQWKNVDAFTLFIDHCCWTRSHVSLVVTILIVILSKLSIFLVPIRANYRVHNKMVTCLLQAPSHFYAVNSAGRILNRFSQDINNLDDLLPFNLVYFFQCAAPGLGAIVLCFLSSVYLIPVCFVVLGLCFGISKFFFSSAMDIKRLMSESGSPLYSHFSNTMEGVRTIRVHKRQQSFIESAYRHIDHQHEAMFAYYTAARWFGITLDLVLGMFCVLVGLFELYTVKDSSTAVS